MKARLIRKSAPAELLTEEQATAVAQAMADKASIIVLNLGARTLRFPWHDVVNLDTVTERACTTCGEKIVEDEPHYCEFRGVQAAIESQPGEIPRYPERVIDEIRMRINPPKGDFHFIAHMERITRLKAEGGKTYLPDSPAKVKLREQRRLIRDGVPPMEAYRRAWAPSHATA
jgi:hypothetical protein